VWLEWADAEKQAAHDEKARENKVNSREWGTNGMCGDQIFVMVQPIKNVTF